MSIVWDRDLFAKGMRWKIGSGNKIIIDEDPWLVEGGAKILLSVKEELKGKRIITLLDEEGG